MKNLIRQILKEEAQSPQFQQIYTDMWDKMLSQVCLKYTKDMSKAEDFCQNGFMKVYKSLKNYTGKGSLEGWVRRVLNNSIIDELRKKKIEYSGDEPDWGRLDKPDEEPTEDKVEMIESVLHLLSPAYKKIFELYYFSGLNHREIAAKLGSSEGASKSNLSKAKKNVIKLVKEKFNQ